MWLLSWGMELTTQKWLSSNPLPPMSRWQWPQPQRKPAWVLATNFTIPSWTRTKVSGDCVTTGAVSPAWRLVYQTQRVSPSLSKKVGEFRLASALWKANPRIASLQWQHIPSTNMWQMLEIWRSNPTFLTHIFSVCPERESEPSTGLVWLVIYLFLLNAINGTAHLGILCSHVVFIGYL